MQLELPYRDQEVRIIYNSLNLPNKARTSAYVSKTKKLSKPERTVNFNKLGSLDILTIPVNKLNGFYKSEFGETFIEVIGLEPIAVRESLEEINNIINIRS